MLSHKDVYTHFPGNRELFKSLFSANTRYCKIRHTCTNIGIWYRDKIP